MVDSFVPPYSNLPFDGIPDPWEFKKIFHRYLDNNVPGRDEQYARDLFEFNHPIAAHYGALALQELAFLQPEGLDTSPAMLSQEAKIMHEAIAGTTTPLIPPRVRLKSAISYRDIVMREAMHFAGITPSLDDIARDYRQLVPEFMEYVESAYAFFRHRDSTEMGPTIGYSAELAARILLTSVVLNKELEGFVYLESFMREDFKPQRRAMNGRKGNWDISLYDGCISLDAHSPFRKIQVKNKGYAKGYDDSISALTVGKLDNHTNLSVRRIAGMLRLVSMGHASPEIVEIFAAEAHEIVITNSALHRAPSLEEYLRTRQ